MRNKRAARKRVSSFEFDAEPSTPNLLFDRIEDVPPPLPDNKRRLDIVVVEPEPFSENKLAVVAPPVPKKTKLDVAVQPLPEKHSITEVDVQAERLIVPKENWNTKQKVNLYSKTRVIELINEKLTAKQKDLFRKGCFGHLLDFKFKKFPSQLIHHLILRQCPQAKPNELWFDIEGTILKFGMREFAVITGLNCSKYPFIFKKNLPESTTKRKFFRKGKSVSRKTLNDVFRANKGGKDEEIVRLAKIYCLESLLIPKKVENNIDPYHLKMVDDPELFDNYPWGRMSYEMTIEYIKRSINSQQAEAYGIGGFPYAVIVWAYETIPTLIKKNFAKKIGNGIPRIINWEADQQPSFREITDRVFDSLELEVCHIVPSKEEMEQPFMAPFVKEKKKEVNGVEEEKEEESEYEDIMLTPTPIREVRRNENDGEINRVVKSLMSKVERMEKTQLEMKKDMEEMYTMLLEIHSSVVDQPSYFVGKYSNKERVNLEDNNDKVIEGENQKMGENDGEKNDEQKDGTEKIDEHSNELIDDVNKKTEGKDSEKNNGQKKDTGIEYEKDNEKVNGDRNEKMEDQETDKNQHKDGTGKEAKERNDEVVEDVNGKMENKDSEKHGEQKDDTVKKDEARKEKVIQKVNEKMENEDSGKHGEQKVCKESTVREYEKDNEKVDKDGDERMEDQETDKNEHKDGTGKEDKERNDEVVEDVNGKMENKDGEKHGEQKDDTVKEDEAQNDKVFQKVNEKMENKDSGKHGEQKVCMDIEAHNDKVIQKVNEKMEDKDSGKHGEQKVNTRTEGEKDNEKVHEPGNVKVADKDID